MIVVDTNVISELMKPEPNESLLNWIHDIPAGQVALTSITVQEIEYGLRKLGDTKRGRDLRRMWQAFLSGFTPDQVFNFDETAARQTASLLAQTRACGVVVPVLDAQIAGICLAKAARLATRNVKDFQAIEGLRIINPFG